MYIILIILFIINLNCSYLILNEEFVIVLSLILLFFTFGLTVKKFIQNFFFFKMEKILFLFLFNILMCRENLKILKENLNLSVFKFWNTLLKTLFLGLTVFLYDSILYKNLLHINFLYTFILKLSSNFLYFRIFITDNLKLNSILIFYKKLILKNLKNHINNVKFFIS